MRMALAAIFPVRSIPSSYITRVPGRRSVASPSTRRDTWKKMSRPPSSGRRKPKPLASKCVTTLPACSPVGASPLASPASAAAWAGRLDLSPTPCLIKARSASDQADGDGISTGIFSSGLRFRASSNNLFWRAFNENILENQCCSRRQRRDGLLPAGALLLGGRLPVALLQTAHHHGGNELFLAVI